MRNASLQILSTSHTCMPLFLLTVRKVRNPLRLPRKTTSDLQKVARDSQSFSTLDLRMVLAPQRCALF